MDARAANDRIADKAHRLHFHSRVPMLCECGRSGCQTILMVSLHEYEEIRSEPDSFLTAPDHDVDGTKSVEQHSGYEVRRGAQRRTENGDRRSA